MNDDGGESDSVVHGHPRDTQAVRAKLALVRREQVYSELSMLASKSHRDYIAPRKGLKVFLFFSATNYLVS